MNEKKKYLDCINLSPVGINAFSILFDANISNYNEPNRYQYHRRHFHIA
jgi:hypothetical protein